MMLTALLISCLYAVSGPDSSPTPGEPVEPAPPDPTTPSTGPDEPPGSPDDDPNVTQARPPATESTAGDPPASEGSGEPPDSVDSTDPTIDPTTDPAAGPSTGPSTGPAPVTDPERDALGFLARAQELRLSGALGLAEAEVTVAISLQPDNAAAYLERAQIRMALADEYPGDDLGPRRARAALLREAAADVDAYLARAMLPADSTTWFQTRRDALLREAEALDPPAPEPVIELASPRPLPPPASLPEVEPTSARDVDHRRRSRALVGSGAVMSAGAVGLTAAGLRLQQACGEDGLCRSQWAPQAPILASAAALTALGTTSVVLGVLDAPGLDRPRIHAITRNTTLALGAAATVLGAATAAAAGALWHAPVMPSDDRGLSTIQTLANTSTASLAAALPLLSAGLTAWLGRRRSAPEARLTRLGLRR